MTKAARAIIIENNKILVMQRLKNGNQYFTLVGGRNDPNETIEQTLYREIKEETGLDITKSRLVYIEEHPEPYNQQYVFLCDVAPHETIAIQDASEEALLNRLDFNIHTPIWAEIQSFSKIAFLTPQLQIAIVDALKNGFPDEPVKLTA